MQSSNKHNTVDFNKLIVNNLDQSECLIHFAIINYFGLKWARNYVSDEDENKYCKTIIQLIKSALRIGQLSQDLNPWNYFDPSKFAFLKKDSTTDDYHVELSCNLIPRTELEGYFNKIDNYLMEKAKMPYDIRLKEHREKIKNG